MGNLDIYDKVREVPENAQKIIGGGRLKGMTDINPMWRIKALTEQFGVCGVGWKYEITDKHIVPGAEDEMSAFVDINLYIKVDGQWSEPIPGTGGSSFISNEKNGLYTNDECYKMALTDAISVACKALGFGADIYWEKDRTKYDGKEDKKEPIKKVEGIRVTEPSPFDGNCTDCGIEIPEKVVNFSKVKYGRPLCFNCQNKESKK